jgi:pimeloyl-ACP methyl ester carboxylesterase
MDRVKSADGCTIAYDKVGAGPAVVLVTGGSVDRTSNAGLAAELASDFTVYNYDRRGRGDSSDMPEYEVQREVEDIAAVLKAAGGSAHLYGTSSGAALAMEAAASGLPILKLALWEPPYILPDRPKPPADTPKIFKDLVDAGRRDEAVEFFMAKVVGLPPEFIEGAKQSPFWQSQVKIAHTLTYDAQVMAGYNIPTERAKAVKVPTIIIDGDASFDFMRETADALAELIPNAQRRRLPDQNHAVDSAVLAPVLKEFFTG